MDCHLLLYNLPYFNPTLKNSFFIIYVRPSHYIHALPPIPPQKNRIYVAVPTKRKKCRICAQIDKWNHLYLSVSPILDIPSFCSSSELNP